MPIFDETARQLFLSMILGTNFSSDSGPVFPFSVAMPIRFGGHLITKKETTSLLTTEKGATSLPCVHHASHLHAHAVLVHREILMTNDSERLAIIVRGEILAMMHLNTYCTWLEEQDAACGVYGSHQITMRGDTSYDLISAIACDYDQPARDRFRVTLFLGRSCHVAPLPLSTGYRI